MDIINYRKRLVEEKISKKMSYSGAVVIEGAKWVGKSTTAAIFANTVIRLQDPYVRRQYQTLASIMSREEILKGNKPILFDEWQDVPEIWDFIRTDIDEYGLRGAYLLTGSTKKEDVKTYHTGTGRINPVFMRPMSLSESGESSGLISLATLFKGEDIKPVRSDITISDISYLICRGGWPGVLDLRKEIALNISKDLLEMIIKKDATEVDGIRKDEERFRKIIKSYARNISTLAKDSTIYKDQVKEEDIVNAKTFNTYVNALKRLYIIEDILPWSFNVRSSRRLRKGVKRQFVDPSIATAALDLTPDKLLKDFEMFGFLFESIVTRDIRVYADTIDARVYYYNDAVGLEVDLIIERPDGSWGGIEVKLGEDEVDKASKNLLELAKLSFIKPSFLLIITNTKMAYRRKDGVYVIPLGVLKP